MLHERDGTRVRASLRGILPAVITLAFFLVGSEVLGRLITVVTDPGTSGAAMLGALGYLVLYLVLIGVGIWLGAQLEHRSYASFGLATDWEWARQCVVGVVLSVSGIVVSLWWGDLRGLREVSVADAGISGPSQPLIAAVAFGLFLCYFFLGNVYEEVIYRRIMVSNFLEGLSTRGVSRWVAIVAASIGSLFVFGMYHVPLRGNLVVAIDAALSGIPFVLAFLLTGRLGLPVGVHFGRIVIEVVHGRVAVGGFTVMALVDITQNTLLANLEVKLVRLGLICLGIVTWAYLSQGGLGIAVIPDQPSDGSP